MKTIKVAKGQSLRSRLEALDACSEAREWAGRKGLRTVWRTCERGDWMLWLAGRVGVDRHVFVLAACECARLSLVHVPAGEDRPRVAIETAERWARGDTTVSIADVRKAAHAAHAAYAAYADADADAAYADRSSAASGVRAATLRLCADIVRKHITFETIDAAMIAGKGET